MGTRKRLVVGIACGLLAALAVLMYAAQVRAEEKMAREEAFERYGGEQVEVCVATRDIAAGEELDASCMEVALWLSDLLPAECVVNPEDLLGTFAAATILKNEPISMARIDTGETRVAVPAGLCAVSIPSQDVRAVGGAIGRGSLVNVYATMQSGVTLLGENILVLDTSNASTERSAVRSSLNWVTLAVTPQSVQELLEVSRSESLYLALPGSEVSADAQEVMAPVSSGETGNDASTTSTKAADGQDIHVGAGEEGTGGGTDDA